MTALDDGITGEVPGIPSTLLAFRVWRYDRGRGVLLSVNAGQPVRANTWLLPNAISSPEGEWPKGELMFAECTLQKEHKGGVPDPACRCGIYATTDLGVLNEYLCEEAPVLGVVELGGRVIPATYGYRAQVTRVAAVLLVDAMFTLPHRDLEKIAAAYRVPALVPHSTDPADYRAEIRVGGLPDIDWDTELRRMLGEGS